MQELKAKLEKVREEARYMADPRDGVTQNADSALELLAFVEHLAGELAGLVERVQDMADKMTTTTEPAPAPAPAQ